MFRKALALLLAGLWAAAATADAPSDPAGPEASREAVTARSAAVVAEIEALQADPSPVAAARVRRLERLERMLERHQEQLRRADELAAQRADLESASGRDVAERVGSGPPFRVSDYDTALAAQTEAEQLLEGLEAAAQDASSSLEEARRLFEKRRGLQEEAGEAPAAGAPAAPESPAAQAELRATAALLLEIAERNLDQRRQKLANAREAVALQQLIIAERRRQADWIAGGIEASDSELEDALAVLDSEGVALEGRRQRAEIELAAAQRRWEALGRRTADAAEMGAVQRAETAALRAELAARQKEIALLGERLDRVEQGREAVERRFAVLGRRAERDDVRSWLTGSQQAAASLERELRLSRAELEALLQDLATLESDLPSDEEAPWRRRQLQALRGAVSVTQEAIESQHAELLREQRLSIAAERALGGRSLAARLQELRDVAGDAWSYELLRSEDRSITVGRIASAILTFILGVLVARGLTHFLGARIMRRLRVDAGAAVAYQSLLYYGLVAFAFLLALRSVDIPLTAFAVIGGALAIGVGFGSQNIVNNFISGLILLAERPIKQGDLVQVEGIYGNVERIGLRSTRVLTDENIHVIVPNSAFLEHNVINWTHTNAEVQLEIKVGVVYGSPTREVERQILRAVAEHPQVLRSPEPEVLFTDFGADALHFQVDFSVRIHSMGERERIESDLRYRIDELFREAGLLMAFPQRDVHLDATNPIPVRLVDGGDDGARG